jgi:uncharacterized alpha-E superfamily protein
MKLLSRVAERLYWLARYLERTENTARLIKSYNNLIMDIPIGSEPSWMILVDILDERNRYVKIFRNENEQNVHKFLVEKPSVTCGIHYSIAQARENMRTTRDVLPEEAWEYTNSLFLYSSENRTKQSRRQARLAYLDEIIQRCQMISGLIDSTLPRDNAYHFIKIGCLIERADMTARITDVGAGDIIDREGINDAIDPILWGSLLEALSAKSAYRKAVSPIVEKNPIVDFLFKAESFPRSIYFCLREISIEIGDKPNRESVTKLLRSSMRKLRSFDASSLTREQLHEFIDKFQVSLIALNEEFYSSWFTGEQK